MTSKQAKLAALFPRARPGPYNFCSFIGHWYPVAVLVTCCRFATEARSYLLRR